MTTERRINATGGQARALYSELMKNLTIKSKPEGGALRNLCDRQGAGQGSTSATPRPRGTGRVGSRVFRAIASRLASRIFFEPVPASPDTTRQNGQGG